MFLSSSSDLNMFSLKNIPSTAAVFSAYTNLTALSMLLRTMANEVRTIASQFIPQQLQEKIFLNLGSLFGYRSSTLTLLIDQYNGLSINQIYEAAEIYLSTKITPSVEKLMVSKALQEKNLSVTIGRGEEIIDVYEGIELKWKLICTETQKLVIDYEAYSNSTERLERRSFELSFHKKHKEEVLNSYLPYVELKSKVVKQENRVVKLHEYGGGWGSMNLHHPSTFETLAMDPVLKKELMDDLDRFVKRREFYKRVGKAWKRGYLLYGPPGTGKSSLIAAMANYLNFDIYDLELTDIKSNSALRSLLVSTANRSILVIEDIDCSVELQDRQAVGNNNLGDNQLTLSGLLNFIDGLWSSCGDARIIVFTTNHKERIDPALLRPGRMDMHIHMSYCTPGGFKQLASNYLGISNHGLFGDIEELIMEVDVTPAEIAEELMKNEDAEFALEGLIKFLQRKKIERNESHAEGGKEDDGQREEKGRKVKKRVTEEFKKSRRTKKGKIRR